MTFDLHAPAVCKVKLNYQTIQELKSIIKCGIIIGTRGIRYIYYIYSHGTVNFPLLTPVGSAGR